MLRALAGLLVVAALKILGELPSNLIIALGTPWLPFYAFSRRNVRKRLFTLKSRAPFATPSPFAYYHMRLRLAALSLRHLRGCEEDLPIRVEGEEHYQSALAGGKPVALLGWHQGPLELLHRMPPAPMDGRPFHVFTGNGFSPLLTRLLHKGRNQDGKKTIELKDQPKALRSWARHKGVLAVMIDQVPGNPGDWLSLWNNSVEIPIPKNLLDWMGEKGAVFIAVSVRLEEDEAILFRYEPAQPDLKSLQRLIESAMAAAPSQYNWSYPKIRTKGMTGLSPTNGPARIQVESGIP